LSYKSNRKILVRDRLEKSITYIHDQTAHFSCKVLKSLKISKGQSESVYRRRTDNTMAKRKRTKGQTTIYKNTYKPKDRVTLTPLKTGGELMCSGRVSSSCSTYYEKWRV
jgi:predicted choloylglycine hydrolase